MYMSRSYICQGRVYVKFMNMSRSCIFQGHEYVEKYHLP